MLGNTLKIALAGIVLVPAMVSEGYASASSSYMPSEELIENCRAFRAYRAGQDVLYGQKASQLAFKAATCWAYIQGVEDDSALRERSCVPFPTEVDILVGLFNDYMEANPEARKYGAASNVNAALQKAYCPK
ncbi:hypothetical protein FE844_004510 [Rhizobium indicum]|uniref:Rap1a/Tai family immunity protein n=1 Tax=Rhizobium indicum TaxID=2583231 RepID=UPI001105DFF5|nr:Rap1a/Tai family immunity protein [Rhizobium indicum]QKK28881.1 hypothetical protein FE844_004510 [Rhizobium indicum]